MSLSWHMPGLFPEDESPHSEDDPHANKVQMFTTTDGTVHDRMKAQTAPAYNGRDIESLEPCVDELVNTMLDLIRSKYASNLDIYGNPPLLEFSSVVSFLTVDVITRALFGKEFGYLKAESDTYGFLVELRLHFPTLAYMLDVRWLRAIVFSKTFLKLFGPKTSDTMGTGKLMGYVLRLGVKRARR